MKRRNRILFAAALLAGAATVGPAQLVTDDEHRLYQSQLGGLNEEGDRVGQALASGDFDGDGADDLAIGLPAEDVGSTSDAGYVLISYGSRDGLMSASSRAPVGIHQDVAGVEDSAETQDHFGATLATGDFDADGYDDLAVGVPDEDSDGEFASGAVQVLYGGPTGLDLAADEIYYGTAFGGTSLDGFGRGLTSCDRTGDGDHDLVIGIPGSDNGTGEVFVLEGTPTGLTTTGALGIQPQDLDEGDEFGARLACADTDGDGKEDLLAVAPFAEFSMEPEHGKAYHLIEGWATVARTLGSETSELEDPGTVAIAAVGDPDGEAMLLVGQPGRDDDHADEGSISILSPGALGAFQLTQDSDLLAEMSEEDDSFGMSLAVGDFDRDGIDDVVFGVPFETLYDGTPEVIFAAGLVHVSYGTDTLPPFEDGTAQTWSWEGPLNFGSLDHDRFGETLAVGDFDADGVEDLAIGAPLADAEGVSLAGIVQILYARPPGWIFGDDFESGRATKWDAVTP